MTERPCRRQVCTTLSKLAVWAKRCMEREPPLTLRLVTANRSERSAVIIRWQLWMVRKYHHCSGCLLGLAAYLRRIRLD